MNPWPFAQWGFNVVGSLSKAPGNKMYLLVATDYFTKGVEALLLVHIMIGDIRKFLWEDLICMFSIPHTIVLDNVK